MAVFVSYAGPDPRTGVRPEVRVQKGTAVVKKIDNERGGAHHRELGVLLGNGIGFLILAGEKTESHDAHQKYAEFFHISVVDYKI